MSYSDHIAAGETARREYCLADRRKIEMCSDKKNSLNNGKNFGFRCIEVEITDQCQDKDNREDDISAPKACDDLVRDGTEFAIC